MYPLPPYRRILATTPLRGHAVTLADRSSGNSRDWAAGVARIPYVYTVELRDRGRHGFLLPPQQILATGVETWEGVKAMMNAIGSADKHRRRQPPSSDLHGD